MPEIHDVTAPMPGTFYASESPSTPPCVTVGAHVAAGETIGLVEVMKMFNEVPAGVAGTVVEIVADNDDAVEAGQVLMRIEVASS